MPKFSEIRPHSTEDIQFKTLLYSVIATADVQTTLLKDLMRLCTDLDVSHLQHTLEVNQEIMKAFTTSLGEDYVIRHGNNFDVLHKEVIRFSKKSMK